jgi:ketosteroid isomerase-like protein
MLRGKVEVVRLIYQAWSAHGSPASSGLLDPRIEWVNPPGAIEPGIRRGLEAFNAAVCKLEEGFDEVRLDIDEYIDPDDDRVVVIGTWCGRGRSSGANVRRRMGYVWTIRDGKAVRFEWFHDPSGAVEAVGLRP